MGKSTKGSSKSGPPVKGKSSKSRPPVKGKSSKAKSSAASTAASGKKKGKVKGKKKVKPAEKGSADELPEDFFMGKGKAYWQFEDPVGSGWFLNYDFKNSRRIERAWAKRDKLKKKTSAVILKTVIGPYRVDFDPIQQRSKDGSRTRKIRRMKGAPPGSWSDSGTSSTQLSSLSYEALPDPFYKGDGSAHWTYEDPPDTHVYKRYGKKQSRTIERSYQSFGKKRRGEVVVKTVAGPFTIDFSSMGQTNKDKTRFRPIRRRPGSISGTTSSDGSDTGSSGASAPKKDDKKKPAKDSKKDSKKKDSKKKDSKKKDSKKKGDYSYYSYSYSDPPQKNNKKKGSSSASEGKDAKPRKKFSPAFDFGSTESRSS